MESNSIVHNFMGRKHLTFIVEPENFVPGKGLVRFSEVGLRPSFKVKNSTVRDSMSQNYLPHKGGKEGWGWVKSSQA